MPANEVMGYAVSKTKKNVDAVMGRVSFAARPCRGRKVDTHIIEKSLRPGEQGRKSLFIVGGTRIIPGRVQTLLHFDHKVQLNMLRILKMQTPLRI